MAFVPYAEAVKTRKWLKSAKSGAVHSPGQKLRQAKAEAKGTATWAKWAAGAQHGTANLQIDVALAVSHLMALT